MRLSEVQRGTNLLWHSVSCLFFLIALIFGSVSSNLTPDPGRLASSSFFVGHELSTELRVATIFVRFFFHLRDYKQQGVSLLARDKQPKSKKEVVMEVIQKSKHFKGNDSATFSLTENGNSDLDMISSEKAVQELYTRASRYQDLDAPEDKMTVVDYRSLQILKGHVNS